MQESKSGKQMAGNENGKRGKQNRGKPRMSHGEFPAFCPAKIGREVRKEMYDRRKPKLEKVGCYYMKNRQQGFEFFSDHTIFDGDVYTYSKGILWRLKAVKEK
jgi:hypothetical protein